MPSGWEQTILGELIFHMDMLGQLSQKGITSSLKLLQVSLLKLYLHAVMHRRDHIKYSLAT